MISIIILVVVVVGAITMGALLDHINKKKKGQMSEEERKQLVAEEQEEIEESEAQCCGMGGACEEHAYLFQTDPQVEYFDDEDLDNYANHDPNSYTEEEVDEFREVLYTMESNDVLNWMHSLKLRNIELPKSLLDEASLIANNG